MLRRRSLAGGFRATHRAAVQVIAFDSELGKAHAGKSWLFVSF